MALFVLRKLILQTRMRSHPVTLNVWCFFGPFVYFHTSFVRTTKALVRLRGCAGWPEPSLNAYVISTIMSWAGSNIACCYMYNMLHVYLFNIIFQTFSKVNISKPYYYYLKVSKLNIMWRDKYISLASKVKLIRSLIHLPFLCLWVGPWH